MVINLPNKLKIHKKKQIALPTKRTINLVGVNEKPIDLKLAAPAIVLIILASLVLSKFTVVDRLSAMSRASRDAASVRSQLDNAYQELDSYGDLTEEYAHYTYAYMTAEELSRVDRTQVIDLIQRVVMPWVELGAWSVKGNELVLNVTGATLQDINLVTQRLYQEENVDFCSVSTAVMNEPGRQSARTLNSGMSGDTPVTAQVIVYLKAAEEAQKQ